MIMHLRCLRCGESFDISEDAMKEVGYTKYSYCEECLRAGLKQLKENDEEERRKIIDKMIEDYYTEQEKIMEKIAKDIEMETGRAQNPMTIPMPICPIAVVRPLTKEEKIIEACLDAAGMYGEERSIVMDKSKINLGILKKPPCE